MLSGKYYAGSANHGLWTMSWKSKSSGDWIKVEGLPTQAVTALKATDDGALYIGTRGHGLWRLEADGTTLAQVAQVGGNHVLQLVYEPTVTPTMLLVLTDRGLTTLRGP
ncbi:MAG: hypothetical protein M3Y59_11275 [Myxococcota bacterium]|nr:hypothetical protein [Myxococcota bacterium]